MPQPLPAQGVPNSPMCRHCSVKRINHGGALLCVECDMTAMMAVETTEAEAESADG
jgi:hypothetical protein